MNFKEGKAILSLFLIISFTGQFIPKANADTFSLTIDHSFVDVYSRSPILQEFVSNALNQPSGGQDESLMSTGINPPFLSLPFIDPSGKKNDIISKSDRILIGTAANASSGLASVTEKIYAAPTNNNGLIFPAVDPTQGDENSVGSTGASAFDCNNFIVQDTSNNPSISYISIPNGFNIKTGMIADCGTPNGADLWKAQIFVNVPSNGELTALLTRYDYPALYDITRTTSVKYLDAKTVQINVDAKGSSESFAVNYTMTGYIYSWLPGNHMTDGSLAAVDAKCEQAYISESFNYFPGQGAESGTPPPPDPCPTAAVYKSGYTYFVTFGTGWTADFFNQRHIGWGLNLGGETSNIKLMSTSTITVTSSATTTTPTSKIIWVSPTKCNKGSSDGFVKASAWIDCYTSGLSADGRVGSAHYHEQQSGSGWGISLVMGALAIGSIAMGFGGVDLFGFTDVIGSYTSTALNVAGTLSNIKSALASSLTGASIAIVSGSGSPMGTVETSNSLGVGNWTWTSLPTVVTAAPVAINGGWSNWGSCSATACGTTGTQTRTCTNPASANGGTDCAGSTSQSCSAPACPTPSCSSFTSSPSQIIEGSQSTLSWSCTNANSCSISADNGSSVSCSISPAGSGSTVVTPGRTTTYTLTANGPGGTTSPALVTTTTVYPLPVCTFTGSPSTIVPPQSTTLSWNCTQANSCSIDNGVGAVSPSGSTKVSPAQSTTYTLTCLGAGNSQIQAKSSFQTSIRTTKFQIQEVAP